MPAERERILVIKLGALGDFILALGPAAAIRRHHPSAEITLLTTEPFAELARASGLFDRVWMDRRPKLWQPGRWLALRRRLGAARFRRVYDLQTSDRSGWYFRLMSPRPEWSGIVPGCSHPHAKPERNRMHTVERQAEQLRMAGIEAVPAPNLSFLVGDAARFGLAARYALLVPGGAAHRPAKRWPAASYAALGARLAAGGVQPVVLGGAEERALAAEIAAGAVGAVSLAGDTTLADVAALARGAACAVGNDTGPMHIVAAVGCPALVLFSSASDPALCAPRGGATTVLRRNRLADLAVDEVCAALPPGSMSPDERPASARAAPGG